MVDATHISFDVSDRSYYAILKKAVHALALNAAFPEKRIAELDIIVAEITSNLHKYADGGEILLAHFAEQGKEFIELICIDNGPGINDVNRVMADGYSTTNTMGHGLGSIKRLSDEFDIYSQKGWGTILYSRVYKTAPPAKNRIKNTLLLSPIVVSKPGETTSGDGFSIKITEQYIKLMLADGLGHGPEANFAVNEAAKAFKVCPLHSPTEIIRYLHSSVRKTRGMVATIVVVDITTRKLSIAGVGNISAKLSGPAMSKSHLAYNGIIGHNVPNTMNDQVLDLADYNQLVLCSDGMRSRWEVNKLPAIVRSSITVQAAAIYKDFARRTDDMSVVIARFN
ncbi:serine/threonine protein kinase [Mucilaginibacter terrenus]|uniref:Serine/threonine protein kinase n=1 Tax=Mucilaginibacter terrenus TaxID=2482727 RepID=A0A3E2NNZ6_9SPHI|nr:ATP-binding SpoIIE family protein phosphatase [Mucilaginibacter terrenus]RFZ82702.1 serine/threonine protein kinase [Mucilaginibacter terrenus]